MTTRRRVFSGHTAALLIALAGTIVWLGCESGKGPTRHPIEGNATYAGKPIPAGQIAFEPDASQGNRGPAAYATIKAGSYATIKGKGTVGGPHVVRITGYDGVANPESPDGMMLFGDYKTTLDLPHEPTTQDFNVPSPHK